MNGSPRKIRRALISVSDKSEIVAFAAALAGRGIALISTGGTAQTLAAAGLAVAEVTTVTGMAEFLDGRVKTLHPAIHGGLLARRDRPDHLAALAERGIEAIDLLVCNLYPFAPDRRRRRQARRLHREHRYRRRGADPRRGQKPRFGHGRVPTPPITTACSPSSKPEMERSAPGCAAGSPRKAYAADRGL